LKKKLQNDKEKRKKRGNVRKIEKKVTKRFVLLCVFCKNCTVFSIRASVLKVADFFVGQNLPFKIRFVKMLK